MGSVQLTALDNLEANMFTAATREVDFWKIGDEMGGVSEKEWWYEEEQKIGEDQM